MKNIFSFCLTVLRNLFERDMVNQGKRPDTACTQFKVIVLVYSN